MRTTVAKICFIAVSPGWALAPPLAGQESTDTTTTEVIDWQRSSLWGGFGLTDVTGDVDAPGSLAELGIEWSPWRLLGIGVFVGSAGIEETGTCERGGFTFECRKSKHIYSASLGARVYAYRNPVFAAFGAAQMGTQSNDLGRFGEAGIGVLFNTVGEYAVGIETRRRFGWQNQRADGTIWVFRFVRGLGGTDGSEGEPE